MVHVELCDSGHLCIIEHLHREATGMLGFVHLRHSPVSNADKLRTTAQEKQEREGKNTCSSLIQVRRGKRTEYSWYWQRVVNAMPTALCGKKRLRHIAELLSLWRTKNKKGCHKCSKSIIHILIHTVGRDEREPAAKSSKEIPSLRLRILIGDARRRRKVLLLCERAVLYRYDDGSAADETRRGFQYGPNVILLGCRSKRLLVIYPSIVFVVQATTTAATGTSTGEHEAYSRRGGNTRHKNFVTNAQSGIMDCLEIRQCTLYVRQKLL